MRKFFRQTTKKEHQEAENGSESPGKDLESNIGRISELLKHDSSLIVREFPVFRGRIHAAALYIEGMVNEEIIKSVNESLAKSEPPENWKTDECINLVKEYANLFAYTKAAISMTEVVDEILSGNCALFLSHCTSALIVICRDIKARNIEKPENELTIRGGKEALTESLNTNMIMLRKRLPVKELRFKDFTIGRRSKTKVKICWLEGIANQNLVEELFRRIERIDIDVVYASSAIVELIEDKPLSIWPQHKITERPDIVTVNMSEGQIAILCDGFPDAVLIPVLITQLLQTMDDYTEKPLVGSLLRLLRFSAAMISMLLSPIYLSFVAYNHTIIPPDLALHISTGRENVPFPSFVELIFMSFIIDMLREAGIRLPKALGSGISILGAVVIGQAAVAAGYVSPALIIVIAISSISTYAVPSIALGNAIRVCNYLLIFVAAISGLFGVILGEVLVIWRLVTLRSFGVPIIHPVDTGKFRRFKDVFVRFPIWDLRLRPEIMTENDKVRVGEKTKKPGKEKGKS